VIRCTRAALVLAAFVAASLVAASPSLSRPAVLAVSTSGAPQSVHGSDGREHVEYDLVVTNSFNTDVVPTSLVVRGGGRTLLELNGDALTNATHFLGGGGPTGTIPPSSTVAMFVDVVMPRTAGRSVPSRLANRISFGLPSGTRASIVGSTTVRAPKLRVPPPAPIEIAPPLRGAGWLSANACCDPLLEHRSFIFPSNGTFVTSEMFAVDYIRLSDGRFYEGDGTENTAWFAYGAPVRAAAAGKVVLAVGDRVDIPPFGEPNPTVHAPSQFAGSNVVIRMRRGVFAQYDHLQPGSIPVEVGDRVRTGQKLGLLGNSGNTSGPHLHFAITDGRNPLSSNSLPFEIDRFRLEGTAAVGPVPGQLVLSGQPRELRRAHPLAQSVSDYSR
jgi:hypothetical protein